MNYERLLKASTKLIPKLSHSLFDALQKEKDNKGPHPQSTNSSDHICEYMYKGWARMHFEIIVLLN